MNAAELMGNRPADLAVVLDEHPETVAAGIDHLTRLETKLPPSLVCGFVGLRLLIATGAAASGTDQLPPSIRALIHTADDILVIAPTLPGRLDWLTSATDVAREHADERLHAVLGQLDDMGVQASGAVAADDPLVAFEDAIREFSPDHLLIALRPQERAGWQERGLLDQVLERFEIPVTAFQLRDR